jgi:hypothetical protein
MFCANSSLAHSYECSIDPSLLQHPQVATYAAASNGNSSSSSMWSAADGLFKNAATVSLTSTDDEQAAAAAATAGAGLAAPSQLHIPKHWEEQIRTAPLGRRRVLQR